MLLILRELITMDFILLIISSLACLLCAIRVVYDVNKRLFV